MNVGISDDCLSHTFYDVNWDVVADPQYVCMISDQTNYVHVERESVSLPQWVWPNPGDPAIDGDGDHVWLAGEFIYDCGHCAGGIVLVEHDADGVLDAAAVGFFVV